MTDKQREEQEFRELVTLLLENEIDPVQKQRLLEFLLNDPQKRAAYRQQATLHAMLLWQNGVLPPAESVGQLPSTADFIREILEEEERTRLVRQKQLAKAEAEHLQASKNLPQDALSTPRTLNDIVPAPVQFVAVAAAVIIAAMMIFPRNEDSPPEAPVAVTEAPVVLNVAARLSAQKDASWTGDDISLGGELEAGQQLSLEAGYAELEMSRGAIVKLQAPVKLELLGHNAIRLDEGTIVGLVETNQAHGFLVETPGLNVRDLGTMFGIHVAESGTSDVSVLEGVVDMVAESAPVNAARTELVAGQSIHASNDGVTITPVKHNTEQFTGLLPRTLPLPSTGQNLGVGVVDPNWRIVAIDGRVLEAPQAIAVSGIPTYYQTINRDLASSKFLSWNPKEQPPVGGFVTYTIQTQIRVPDDVNLADVRVLMRYMADNSIAAVIVNGNRLQVDQTVFDEPYDRWIEVTCDQHLLKGPNVIEFEVRNHRFKERQKGNFAGLRVEWEMQVGPDVFGKE